ncbi:sigma-70 family RNA polymerase sigma factor [bacterium]|nr:MAG: sigma-70 family RNA polymerase sigma factor [bacterium]
MKLLLDRILEGDGQAVTIFYKKYSPRIYKYLLKKVPREDAQEILNDIFIEVIDKLAFLHDYKKILPYLYKIAHNKTVDFYRKKKIRSLILSKLPFLELISKEIDRPDFQYEKNLIRDRIENTLHSLSFQYQKILRLHYEENIPVKNIAVIFNLSCKATESLLFRARQSFKKTYERI